MSVPESHSPAPPPPSPPGVPARDPWHRPVVAALVIAVIAASASAVITHLTWPGSSTAPSSFNSSATPGFGSGFAGRGRASSGGNSTVSPSGSASTAAGTSAAVAARIDPGLVDINTTLANDDGEAAGTGMVVTSSGEVITNNHVIDGATRITARDVGNGKTYTATVVGYDPSSDVAVLQLEHASGLKTVPLGNSSGVRVGAAVVTIGNAGGTGGTPSIAGGSVLALDQSITAGDDVDASSENLTGLIEIDGELQPGDSGGPLVDSSNSVVGMDTAASSSFSFQSAADQGFAIPINTVLAISKQIVAGEGSNTIHIGPTAMLGIYIEPSSSAGGYGYVYGYGGNGSPGGSSSNVSGVPVAQVVAGGPAAHAGLAQGDTITALNGQSVSSEQALMALMLRHRPGDQVRVSWVDSAGSSHTATLRLGTGPSA
jgi:S1-C subfamily serine protease